ncbi:Hypothetical_protein [Hexamita inflata]|uniref:Hypothetical_protein n=1 Tax=Hexamita inflata TaxID=28002 RepID=A0AA86RAC5_9EUKA|nr:Hypothetical protein HINF_LOCUS60147 [Hexamita inflata]
MFFAFKSYDQTIPCVDQNLKVQPALLNLYLVAQHLFTQEQKQALIQLSVMHFLNLIQLTKDYYAQNTIQFIQVMVIHLDLSYLIILDQLNLNLTSHGALQHVQLYTFEKFCRSGFLLANNTSCPTFCIGYWPYLNPLYKHSRPVII